MDAWPRTPIELPVTVCVLCFGDYPKLAERVLQSIARYSPKGAIRLRIGLNAVSDATREVIERVGRELEVELLIDSEVNLYKAGMMRRLFYDRPIQTPWTVWFDDDSFVRRGDWLEVLCYRSHIEPDVDLWGKALFIRAEKPLRDYIYESLWFAGREMPEDDWPGRWRLNFIAGGYWAIRTVCLQRLDWPDRRLAHFGDDYLLGEAMRQIGARQGNGSSGISINCASRRAPEGTPSCGVLR